jgi:predicted Holliday junction resolvase-like endonuclease
MTFVSTFQKMRQIYGFCPCCDEPFRLSDASLFFRSKPPTTEFDQIDAAWEKVERQKEYFEDIEEEIRQLARERGQRAAQRRVRSIVPFLKERRIEPADVKVLFHPVEYVVFRGLYHQNCAGIEFVDHLPESQYQERVLNSISESLKAGNVEWQTYRVNDDATVVLEEE